MKILKLTFITTQQITETFIDIYRDKLHKKLTFILQRHLYYIYRQITETFINIYITNYREITQQTYIYIEIYINTTNYRDIYRHLQRQITQQTYIYITETFILQL